MIRRPPRSTLDRSSAASDVYKRQGGKAVKVTVTVVEAETTGPETPFINTPAGAFQLYLSLIHISEPTRPY